MLKYYSKMHYSYTPDILLFRGILQSITVLKMWITTLDSAESSVYKNDSPPGSFHVLLFENIESEDR